MVAVVDNNTNTSTIKNKFGSKWSHLYTLPTNRSGYSLVSVGTDRLVFIGGYEEQYEQSIDVWNIRTDKWTRTKLKHKRSDCAAVAIGEIIYIFGGHDGRTDLNSFEKIDLSNSTTAAVAAAAPTSSAADPAGEDAGDNHGDGDNAVVEENGTGNDAAVGTIQSVEQPPMRTVRRGCCAVVYDKRYIVVLGGYNATSEYLSTVEMYDSHTGTWSDLPPMTEGRSDVAAVNFGPYIVVAGNDNGCSTSLSVEQLDMKTKTWKQLPNMSESRSFCGGVAISQTILSRNANTAINHKSNNNNNNNSHIKPTTSSTTTSKQQHNNKDEEKAKEEATDVDEDHIEDSSSFVMVVAGDSNFDSSTVEVYDSNTNEWLYLPSMKTISGHCQLVTLDDHVIAAGKSTLEGLSLFRDTEDDDIIPPPRYLCCSWLL